MRRKFHTCAGLLSALALGAFTWLAAASSSMPVIAAFPFSYWKSGATPTPPPTDPNPITRIYVSDGDANGVFYFAGQNFTTSGVWANPHTDGRVVVVRSSNDVGTATDVVDRTTNDSYTGNAVNSWVAIDLGVARSAVVTKYSLRNRSFADRAIRNWKLQGTNSAASNSVADLAAAAWTDLETRTGDVTMASVANQWATYTLGATPAAYRWLRILQTGVNAGGDYYLTAATEIEFYGTLSY